MAIIIITLFSPVPLSLLHGFYPSQLMRNPFSSSSLSLLLLLQNFSVTSPPSLTPSQYLMFYRSKCMCSLSVSHSCASLTHLSSLEFEGFTIHTLVTLEPTLTSITRLPPLSLLSFSCSSCSLSVLIRCHYSPLRLT